MIKFLLISALICGQANEDEEFYDSLAELYIINEYQDPLDSMKNPQMKLALYRYGIRERLINKNFGNYDNNFEDVIDTHSLLSDIRYGYDLANKIKIPPFENLPTKEVAARYSLIAQTMYQEYKTKIHPQAAPWNIDEADFLLQELKQFNDVWFAMEWFHYCMEKENYQAAREYLKTIKTELGSVDEINNYEPFAWWRITPTLP